MALTIASLKKDVAGNKRMHSGQITFDSSYDTGGESLVPKDIGLHKIEAFEAFTAAGFTFEYDYANQKLKVICPAIVTATAGAATLDDYALTGTGATTARSVGIDNAHTSGAIRFGGQQEVAATTNLSAVVCRFVAIGY